MTGKFIVAAFCGGKAHIITYASFCKLAKEEELGNNLLITVACNSRFVCFLRLSIQFGLFRNHNQKTFVNIDCHC